MSNIGNFFRSPSFKFIVIGMLSLLLLIPAGMIRGLINEREMRNREAANEISQSWSLAQTITGPYFDIPTEETKIEDRKEIVIRNTYHLLPEVLDIKSEVTPLEKKRGIFSAVVYNAEVRITGHFNLDDEEIKTISSNGIMQEKVYLNIGISDLRGVGNNSSISIDGTTYEMKPGLYNRHLSEHGIHVPLDAGKLVPGTQVAFDITLDLKGSTDLYFTPAGKTTSVAVNSTWPDPSFTGNFLPADKKITEEGFDASWEVNYLNRNYPQGWYNTQYKTEGSSFGVYFMIPVDHYQKSERSVKYAFIFIALSFLVFFLTEIILKTRIHPIQYLLVGFALIVFYTLLVSLSEHVGFNIAYLVSTLAVTILVGSYMRSSTSSGKVGFISGLLLLGLYGFLFTTLQLQELSLLMGSIGLFIILAIVMVVSRKINWYRESVESRG